MNKVEDGKLFDRIYRLDKLWTGGFVVRLTVPQSKELADFLEQAGIQVIYQRIGLESLFITNKKPEEDNPDE